ncbi:MAG: tRNA (N(6)-L-threonylcarbamoyladenosine(37)-C(2))-methylthiotransferase MtaB [Prevotellaceae bacterium]|nr:tRNA (N(6)-L-threonylcarbamoyladenosine(37)-C(2))-methylthiotransferase MtaB [Prevotellaceae bacterium]
MNEHVSLRGKKAAYLTLGCKLNFAETASLAERLLGEGVQTAGKGEVADLCIVNTCSVTEVADAKSRQAIRRMVRLHPGACVVVTGCYAQLKPKEIAMIEGVSLVVGTERKAQIIELIGELLAKNKAEDAGQTQVEATRTAEIRSFVPSCACGNRTRYFLKVQDGCDYFCTYCAIPFARGRSRNASVSSLVRQAQAVASRGGKEIVLTGVNIGDFGKTTGERFVDLVRQLDTVEGIARYRISSIEPDLLTDEIVQVCASSRSFMPHFHLPLQSGADEVLRLMRRHYDADLFCSKVNLIRELMPDAFVGVDVIVGTRGETSALFEQSLKVMEELPVSQFHVFSYSERPGTAALRIPHRVTAQEKHERSQRVLALSEQKTRAFYEKYIGTVRPVLLEHGPRRNVRTGFTDNYIKVEVRSELDNEIVSVRLDGWNEQKTMLRGTVV